MEPHHATSAESALAPRPLPAEERDGWPGFLRTMPLDRHPGVALLEEDPPHLGWRRIPRNPIHAIPRDHHVSRREAAAAVAALENTD
jgi:hypothetical protein